MRRRIHPTTGFRWALLLGALASPWSQRALAQSADAGAGAPVAAADAGAKALADAAVATDGAPLASDAAVQNVIDAEVVPWSAQAAAELPSFLTTADTRVKDQRPPPSAAQLAALKEMESAVDAFKRNGDSYKDTVVSIVRREYLRQRRLRSEGFSRQISDEEKLQDQSTARAIELFEKFIKQYPNDPTYTPDAMFRLGELYFERSAIQFQNQMLGVMASRDKGLEVPEPDKDFALHHRALSRSDPPLP